MSELALQLIKKEKEERTGKLDLGNCGLTDFPDELFELDWLEELNFCSIYWDFGMQGWYLSRNIGKQNKFNKTGLPDKFEHLRHLKAFTFGGDVFEKWSLNDFSVLKRIPSIIALSLRANQICDISFLEELTGLEFLQLGDNTITDTSPLKNLDKLANLELSSNPLKEVSCISDLSCLTNLDLSFSRISDISFLKNLTGITNLDLRYNNINDISWLEKLTNITNLNLRNNQISNIHFLEKLTGLNTLGLSYVQFSDVSFMEKLTSLTTLEIRENQISDYNFLKSLTCLKNLDLGNNRINDYTFLKNLSGLKSLDLHENKIYEAEFLRDLTGLKTLRLSDNKISDISFLERMIDLTSLDLSSNQISDILPLKNLTNLSSLDLKSNKVSDISSLTELSKLVNLNLSSNQIKELDSLVPLLKKGLYKQQNLRKWGGVSLFNNAITSPPINIVEQGSDAILEWFSQIDKTGSTPFFESKLMILGQGGAGKTTFANLLLDPKYEVKPGKLDSTIGVVVNRGKEFVHTEEANVNIQAHLWDFGGQNIQKMLHQFFITEECLYVLVSDKRAENTNFDYWFQIINLLGPKSNVIVLENPKEAKHANEKFALNKYQELYPELTINSIEVNLNQIQTRHKKRWASLQEMIAEKLSDIELVNRKVPRKWGLVRKALKEREGLRYIRKDEYYKLCEDPSIDFNKRQADWCLDYFRSVGDLVYFDDRDLCTHIFLDQNWLTKGMYYILSDKKIEERGGRFTREQAFSKWDSNNYSEEEKVMLINLLLKDKFDICYEIPDQKDVFITPLLLPSDKPKNGWEHETNLRFRYHYGFIPHGLFSRLIVQLNDKIEKEQQWKTGMRLIDSFDGGNSFAEVQQFNDPQENQTVIDIKISGNKSGCKHMLSNIRHAVDKLHKDFKNINVKSKVACNCETCLKRMQSEEKPSFYDYDMLWDKVINRSFFVDCQESRWKQVNIGQIISDIVIENAANENKDNHLLKQLKEMGMSINHIKNINNNNNQSAATANAKAEATAKSEVTITISNMLGEVQNLTEDFEDEKKLLLNGGLSEDDYEITLKDINKAEKAIEQLETAQNNDDELPARSKGRLTRFINALGDEESSLHKGLKLMRQGRDYGVQLAELYNNIATNTGMPAVPPVILDVIKKL
ncbi:leucine-rich repeat domain-containing protein [Carboxylicivirga sp. A043]|uniref:leucine-rich repeat domain-containing protein n=1 Tax=Carboxylicivirga litoralis TaxID=2816963 RepID=UPI0021CB3625|nr:COR domain-containing protein [Carboxylicivirga sp. A043]MCU4154544.1 leucine-rich repeat domain-containing protein [Carboxylicivirga sp. A043]